MPDIFQKIRDLPILEVLDSFNIGYIKRGPNYMIKKDDGSIDESFSISPSKNIATDYGKSGISGNPFDLIARLALGLDPQTNEGKVATIKAFVEKGLVENPLVKKEFVKTIKSTELLENYDSLKLGGYKTDISQFLVNRGVSYDWITKNQLHIGEVFADIGYYSDFITTIEEIWKDEDGNWCHHDGDKARTTAVFIFPCMDEYGTNIGVKLRRRDGKTIRGKKSYAPYGNKTGLLYPIGVDNNKTVIIVEGEMDYIILRLLGYKNVVANLGGVQSNRQRLKNLLFDVPTIICLYDTDVAGTTAKKELADVFGRQIHEVVFPIREDAKGIILSDVNDFYKAGYDTKAKWDKLLLETKVVGEEQAKEGKYPFIVLRKHLKYYDIEYKKLYDKGPIADELGVKAADLISMRKNGEIQTYEDLCYLEGGKPSHYNTLDMTTVIKNGGDAEAKLHPHIKHLIDNVCSHKKKNIDWVHKSILFKLTHINNVHIPGLVLYGTGGSGKGTFINLLSKIFGDENCLKNLKQRDLESNFDSYQGQKLIVEFQEVSSGNKFNDKKILDRIKSMIGEEKITVNAKFENAREVDNIARFHLSSNHAVPIQMDSKHSGNRRFTIIKTGNALDHDMAEEMNHKTFKDRLIIRQYVNWLYETYPEVVDMTTFAALDNEEKRNLEEVCEGVANQFFEWLERRNPNVTRISNPQKNFLLDLYCQEVGEDKFDIKFKQGNFDLGLSHRYEKKIIRLGDKTTRGYFIKKTKYELELIPESHKGYFSNDNEMI